MPTWFTLRSQMQSAAKEQPVVVTSIGYRRDNVRVLFY